MSKIIAVVPNISEGRDAAFLEMLTAKLVQIKDLAMLDVSRDSIRNRTIFSFTGTKEAIFAGGRLLYGESLQHINMQEHRGEYPRIGAVDVFPFVPLKDVAIEETIAMSKEFAQLIATEFSLPVYLFSESAQYPTRRELDNIREGEFEGLEEKLQDPRWKPDFGPDQFIPRSGATIIGARYPLISFTVTLNTTDSEQAHAISRSVQYNDGGFKHVKTYVASLPENHYAQIWVNLSNYRETPMYRVIEMLRLEARRYGLTIARVDMVGLIPEQAFIESALYYMNVADFSIEKLLERNVQKHLDETIT